MKPRALPATLIGAGLLLALLNWGSLSTASAEEAQGAGKTSAVERAERRLFDGAPPVIPHEDFGASCIECHGGQGVAVEGVGFSPPNPHEATEGMSAISRCRQCHVFQVAEAPWRESDFVAFRQDLRKGKRFSSEAPPVMPHGSLMRENCSACHDGPAAREEIRTPHPERIRCQQCHVERKTSTTFP